MELCCFNHIFFETSTENLFICAYVLILLLSKKFSISYAKQKKLICKYITMHIEVFNIHPVMNYICCLFNN